MAAYNAKTQIVTPVKLAIDGKKSIGLSHEQKMAVMKKAHAMLAHKS